jgi:radical S-adenosyl methionine domain-containing protein 2
MEKINFAGGEPFIHADLLGALAHFCKHDLGDVAVSIISNGSLIQEDWLDQWGDNVDVLGVSVDSFVEATNDSIGRGCPGRDHLLQVKNVRSWCDDKGIKFKLNTVVNALNVDEDMNLHIAELRPDRWKVFQLLLLQGENTGGRDIRDATSLKVSPQQFQTFVARHAAQPSLVPEDNAAMQNSYLLLDEKMRFLDCSSGGKVPSRGSILEVGVPEALRQAGFDRDMFIQRGGVYDWRK